MFITINQCRLFFDIYGSKLNIHSDSVKEKPTLIVLHGGHGMADHTLYVEFWSQFSNIAQVIFLDQRGCGRSEKRTEEEWNLEYWAEDVYQFCQMLGIEKPILAGVSMGGHVICEYVRHHADNLGGIIFCNTEARFIAEEVCQNLAEIGGEEVGKIARKQFNDPSPEITRAYQEKCIPYYAKNAYTPTELGRCKQNLAVITYYFKHYMQHFNYLEDLKNISCPTLFMVGGSSPLHLPVRAFEMAEQIKPEWVMLQVFKNAGAPVYKDAPDEAENMVRQFFKILQ